MRAILLTILIALGVMTGPASAQIALPTGQVRVPELGPIVSDATGTLDTTLEGLDAATQRTARRLLQARERSLNRLLRNNRNVIERDSDGDLARRGEVLAMDIAADDLLALSKAGFVVLESESIEGLDIAVTRFKTPSNMDLDDAEELARKLAPNADITADNLHFQSGTGLKGVVTGVALQSSARIGTEVGIIDGAPAKHLGSLPKKLFASGQMVPSDHGTNVASLLKGAGVMRLRAADVYGDDPAGGNALALARALGWLTASGSKVVTISLVGPRNAVVERAVKSAQAQGVVIVAAVGNDGPAAPAAYPASYNGVVAVTGVDKRRRALIEAGRALHLDYAAPGADIYGLDAKGAVRKLRGTSFATPLVAARLAAAMDRGTNWRVTLDAEARDLGKKGHDETFGRGLVCETCAQGK